MVAADDATASIRKPTNIPAENLGSALQSLAQERGFQVVYLSETVDKLKTPGAVGVFTADEALKQLLKGTGLSFHYLDEKTITVVPTPLAPRVPKDESALGSQSFWNRFRLAQAETNSPASFGAPSEAAPAAAEPMRLEEVVVTAQKREQRLQDVPVPVTVLGGEALTQSNQVRLEDYYGKVPGLNFTLGGDSPTPLLAIRGISNGNQYAPPTVGVVVDDIPYGSTTGLGGRGQPDIDPGDLARVEVLRGPQGTLYGANSMGGLLKFVTTDPSVSALSGHIQAGTSTLFNGVGPGYNFRGSINVPVTNTTALRASAFRNVDGGYIDNIQTGEQGVNRRTSDGGRLSVLWKPSDVISLKLSALVQDSRMDGPSQAVTGPIAPVPGVPSYPQVSSDLQVVALPNTWTNDEKTQVYSATVKASLGAAELISLTGYNIDTMHFVSDFTPAYGGFWSGLSQQYTPTHESGALELGWAETRRVSQELRLSVPIGARLTWLIGGFYTNEKNAIRSDESAVDAVTGADATSWLDIANHLDYVEYAAFTNITYELTKAFNIQMGGRASTYRETFDSLRSGPAAGPFFGTLEVPDLHSKDTALTYLVTPQYRISPDLMVYARVASGYRPGGPNVACGVDIPCQYDAEKTQNYELGVKGDFLDHVISIDASLYHIDWKGIVESLPAHGVTYYANLGRARSQGIEFSVDLRPVRGLSLSAWIAYDAAEYADNLPDQGIAAGQRLPYSTRVSGNFALDDEFSVSGALSAFVGGSLSYVGARTSAVGNLFPAYPRTDLRAGFKYDTWTLSAFINNVADRRGILGGGGDYTHNYPNATTYLYIQPRTFGVNVSRAF